MECDVIYSLRGSLVNCQYKDSKSSFWIRTETDNIYHQINFNVWSDIIVSASESNHHVAWQAAITWNTHHGDGLSPHHG